LSGRYADERERAVRRDGAFSDPSGLARPQCPFARNTD
jgi:hypothetical protein